jgi:hypothetical protein
MTGRGEGHPVVAIDIDGTLGDYHSHFLWFAERWLGHPMPPATEVNPGMRLSTFMGVPHHVYQECKLAYRQGGLKRFMPAYPYASELTHNIHGAGAEVWICTTRPYLRLDNIDPDTREWLRRNNIKYDAVIWEGLDGTTKYADLEEQVGVKRIVAAVDDLEAQTADAVSLGINRVYLRDQPYNRGPQDYKKYTLRVNDLEWLSSFLKNDINVWRDRQHGTV